MDEKRQRDAEETAKRRAEEERELAKHIEWQQQMEKQMTEDALRKQGKEEQERLHQQQLQDEMEQRKKQDEIIAKRSNILFGNIPNNNFNSFSNKTTRKTNDTRER
jgi:hypothetical protein